MKTSRHDISFAFSFRTYTLLLYILLHQKAHIESYFYKNLCNKNKLYSLYQCKQGLSGNSMNRENNSIGNLYVASSHSQHKYISAHVTDRGKDCKRPYKRNAIKTKILLWSMVNSSNRSIQLCVHKLIVITNYYIFRNMNAHRANLNLL